MAKKVRRVKKKRKSKMRTEPAQEDAILTASTSETTEQQLSSTEQFRLEYAYVVKDLRRVLILAALMFALLIALNLLLR